MAQPNKTLFLENIDNFRREFNQAIDSVELESTSIIKLLAPLEIQAAFLDFNRPYLKIDHSGLGDPNKIIEEIGVLKLEQNQVYLEIFLNSKKNTDSFIQRYLLMESWSTFWKELRDKFNVFNPKIYQIVNSSFKKDEIKSVAKLLVKIAQEKELNLVFFLPYLDILKSKGFEISFQNDEPNNFMLFPVCTHGGLRFVKHEESQIQSYRHKILESFDSFQCSPIIKQWVNKKVVTASSEVIFKLANDPSIAKHVYDFIISEDFEASLPHLDKISLSDMVTRSQKWLLEIAKRVYLEKEGDSKILFKTDDFFVVQLLTQNSLDREGAILAHCIGRGGYDALLKKGTHEFYSLRNKKNESLVTIEYDKERNFILEVQSYKNSQPLIIHSIAVKEFIKFKFPTGLLWFYEERIAKSVFLEQIQLYSIKSGEPFPGAFIFEQSEAHLFKNFPLLNPRSFEVKAYKAYLNSQVNDEIALKVEAKIERLLHKGRYLDPNLVKLKRNLLNLVKKKQKLLSEHKIIFLIRNIFNKNECLQSAISDLKSLLEDRSFHVKNRELLLFKDNDYYDPDSVIKDREYLILMENLIDLINKSNLTNVKISEKIIHQFLENNQFLSQKLELIKLAQRNQALKPSL